MVILIGGVSCSGKTKAAQKLLEKYKIPYLSIDHIKMGLIRGGKYCDFSATDSDEEITDKLWPVVKGIVMTCIENSQNIVIEGCYLPPGNIKDFEPEYSKDIIAFYIIFSRRYIDKHFSAIARHRNDLEHRRYDDCMSREELINEHARLKELCEKSGAKYFEINDDYVEEIKKAFMWIDMRLQEKGFISC